ncbi:TNT domain-containing protein [Mycobacterium sp.]|uniref:TNT domain-containing protein n=1 Tax=Mycobacterium sp. TaxID=1785 RepID=UPI0031D3721E
MQGELWPNGHQDQLHSAAQGWRTAAAGLRAAAFRANSAAPYVASQKSPEIPAAIANCNKVHDALNSAAEGCDTAAKACDDYASAIDEAHHKIIHEMEVLGATVAATEVLALVLVPLTAGASEAVSKVVDVSRLTATGARIATIIREFRTTAELSALPTVSAAGAAARSIGELAPILDASVILHTTVTGKRIEEAEAAAARAENLTVEEFEARYGKPGAWKYPEESDPAKPYAIPGTVRTADPTELRGMTVDRYGSNPIGGWLAPEGTPYGARAMAPGGDGAPLTTYRIGEGPLPPGYTIEESKAATWFGESGGGTQYRIIGPDGKTALLDKFIQSGFLVEVSK